jgi:peptidyl-prolyl cis-trans isomerase C
LIYINELSFVKMRNPVSCKWLLCGVLMLVAAVGLTACGNKEKKAGQSLVRVDGQEITVLQLNEELQRANVPAGQQEAASKQLLESLIGRQLIIAEAMRNKIDRTPDVIGAIERAKAQIIAQAYLQGITAKIAKPSKAEIDDYFQKHPELFAQRKQFDMKSLLIASTDLSDELKSTMDSAKSLDEIAAWLVKHDVKYAQGQGSRSSTDLPPEMALKLQSMPKGHLFIVNEGGKSMLVSLVNIKDSPITAKDAAPQIEQYLINKKTKDVADTEITHLRSLAKIEYLNASAPVAATAGGSTSQVSSIPETKPASAAAGTP